MFVMAVVQEWLCYDVMFHCSPSVRISHISDLCLRTGSKDDFK